LKEHIKGLQIDWRKFPDYENGLELSSAVCTQEPLTFMEMKISSIKVAGLDFWHKKKYSKKSCQRGSLLPKVFPAKPNGGDGKAWSATPYFFSNGSG